MITTLPAWITTLIHNVCLEVLVFTLDTLHLRRSESDVRIRRLHLIYRVKKTHR